MNEEVVLSVPLLHTVPMAPCVPVEKGRKEGSRRTIHNSMIEVMNEVESVSIERPDTFPE